MIVSQGNYSQVFGYRNQPKVNNSLDEVKCKRKKLGSFLFFYNKRIHRFALGINLF